jgi:hypothetical protein
MKYIHAWLAASATIIALSNSSTQAATIPAVFPTEAALQAVESIKTPEGLAFTGAIETLLETPTDTTNNEVAETRLESFRGRGFRFGRGYGYGGFGPYRFGYSCGGIAGWAYPLGYWDTIGAGLYGVSACGLGYSLGGLFYC